MPPTHHVSLHNGMPRWCSFAAMSQPTGNVCSFNEFPNHLWVADMLAVMFVEVLASAGTPFFENIPFQRDKSIYIDAAAWDR